MDSKNNVDTLIDLKASPEKVKEEANKNKQNKLDDKPKEDEENEITAEDVSLGDKLLLKGSDQGYT